MESFTSFIPINRCPLTCPWTPPVPNTFKCLLPGQWHWYKHLNAPTQCSHSKLYIYLNGPSQGSTVMVTRQEWGVDSRQWKLQCWGKIEVRLQNSFYSRQYSAHQGRGWADHIYEHCARHYFPRVINSLYQRPTVCLVSFVAWAESASVRRERLHGHAGPVSGGERGPLFVLQHHLIWPFPLIGVTMTLQHKCSLLFCVNLLLTAIWRLDQLCSRLLWVRAPPPSGVNVIVLGICFVSCECHLLAIIII